MLIYPEVVEESFAAENGGGGPPQEINMNTGDVRKRIQLGNLSSGCDGVDTNIFMMVLTVENSVKVSPVGSCEDEGEGEGENRPHTGDQNGDGVIFLSELLRLIQFFNSGGYVACESGEDGFCPGTQASR